MLSAEMPNIGGPDWQRAGNGVLQQVQRNNIAIRFYMKAVEDEEATATEGRPIFKDLEYIEKRTPGENLNVIDKPVEAKDKKEFAQQYAHWKATQENPLTGTPLREWACITRADAETLNASGIRTVEELAEVSDDVASRLGVGAKKARQQARDWLARAKDNAAVTQLRAELDARDAKIAALEHQMADILARVEEKTSKSKK